VSVCPVQLPGRWNRLNEPPFTDIDTLIDSLAPAIVSWLDRPFIFFGHSMGAMVAFELVHRLRTDRHRLPHRLLVSGRRAPQIPNDKPQLHTLPQEDLIRELRTLNGTPPELLEDQSFMALLLPVLRADLAVCETYRYRPHVPLEIPITAFGGADDRDVSLESLSAWHEHTLAEFQHFVFPGDHFFLQQSEEALIHVIRREVSNIPALF
jgi:medium-chain acyl-[acyl-carrier-protein] hydrolase